MPRTSLLRDECHLADPSFSQPVAPEPVRGQQLVQCLISDLRGDAGGVGGERTDQRVRHGAVGATAVFLPADNQPRSLQASEHLLQRREPDRVGVRHALSLPLGERQALFHGEGEPSAAGERLGYLSKQWFLLGEGEHGLEEKHHIERAGWDWRDPGDLEATGKVAGALPRDVDRTPAEVHPEIGAAEVSGDEASGPGDSAAQVQHGDAGCDAGSIRQRSNLAGAHEALLVDELAGGIRRRARLAEGRDERSAFVLLHGPPPDKAPRGGRIGSALTSFVDMESNYAAAAAACGESPRHRVAVAAAPLTGLVAQVLLIAALAVIVGSAGAGLDGAGWVVGIICGAIVNAGLARGLRRFSSDRLAPADWVTLTRATLAVGVAALVASSFDRPVPVALLVSVTALALALDAVDGWIARRTQTGALGAQFDGEVDAFLILVLSVYVARSAGVWLLTIGAARYAFLAAGWVLPWMREPLPPRYWRKVVAATQGIVLTVAAAHVLPPAVTSAALVAALVLLAESFGRDVLWLRRHRPATESRAAADADHTTPGPGHERLRTGAAAALTIVALLFVWGALVAPDQPVLFKPSAFVRLPLEGLIVICLVVVLPARARRVLVWILGPVLALVVLLKILDLAFFAAFNRPFDPYQDVSYAGTGAETLRASIGRAEGNLIIAFVVGLVVA